MLVKLSFPLTGYHGNTKWRKEQDRVRGYGAGRPHPGQLRVVWYPDELLAVTWWLVSGLLFCSQHYSYSHLWSQCESWFRKKGKDKEGREAMGCLLNIISSLKIHFPKNAAVSWRRSFDFTSQLPAKQLWMQKTKCLGGKSLFNKRKVWALQWDCAGQTNNGHRCGWDSPVPHPCSGPISLSWAQSQVAQMKGLSLIICVSQDFSSRWKKAEYCC